MPRIADTITLYFKLLGIALKAMVQFRADFLIGIVGIISWNVVRLLAVGVILGRFHNLAGWTLWEIAFLFGLWMTGNSLYSLLFYHLSFLDEYIVDGAFDRFLIRPISPFLQFLAVDVNINGVADVIFGVVCLSLAMTRLHLTLNGLQWLFLVIMLISAALLELGMTILICSVAFWTNRSQALFYTLNQVNWSMTQQYPLEMFGRGFRVLVTCVIPVAFINYYPARWLLGKTDLSDPWYFLSFLSPVVTVLLLTLAGIVWRRGIRRYSSTGS